MRTSAQMVQQIAYERRIALESSGDPERPPHFLVTPDEYYVLCYSTDPSMARWQVETDLKTAGLRPFMGRQLARSEAKSEF